MSRPEYHQLTSHRRPAPSADMTAPLPAHHARTPPAVLHPPSSFENTSICTPRSALVPARATGWRQHSPRHSASHQLVHGEGHCGRKIRGEDEMGWEGTRRQPSSSAALFMRAHGRTDHHRTGIPSPAAPLGCLRLRPGAGVRARIARREVPTSSAAAAATPYAEATHGPAARTSTPCHGIRCTFQVYGTRLRKRPLVRSVSAPRRTRRGLHAVSG